MLRAALLLLLSASPALAQGIEVRDAYAFSPRPGAPTGAAYMVIVDGGEADRLLSASSPAAEHVMLHDSAEAEGVMRMEEAGRASRSRRAASWSFSAAAAMSCSWASPSPSRTAAPSPSS